ncbi:hypothetical protein DE146DRAFT_779065 [Phaeosphaeria sp. MPI-PUGE-AT-0046c]|nr:hypothetical protein DE146DRAFT_779065 [Phaeosphaeria sp. MPI-PUGE-AT-0046c]
MAEVQSQPLETERSEPGSQAADREALVARLDVLLEKYLHTIDAYQKAREQLAKQLASGYLSLAQANFQNRNGSHYGQDNYDERMQAIRRVDIQADDTAKAAEEEVSFVVVSDQPPVPNAKGSSSEEPKDKSADSEKPSGSTDESKKASRAVDPMRWFGILVPPALRSAQSSFINAVEGSIPSLVTVARDLRNQEIEIGRVRKQIKKS